MLGILLDENVGVLFGGVATAGRVGKRHEVVVEVVVAAHSNGIYALAQIICGGGFVA